MQYIKCLLLEPCNNPSYSGIDYYKSLSFSYLNADYNTKILNYVNVYTKAHNEISYKTQQNLSNSTSNRSYDALMLYNGLYGYKLDGNGKPESDNIIITHYPMLSNDPNINQYMYLYNVRATTLNKDSYNFYSISAEHILPVLIVIKDPWITDYLSKKIVQYDTWFEDESAEVKALGPRILTPDIYPLQLPHILDFLEITYATAELNTIFNNVSSGNINVNIYIKLTKGNHLYNNQITWYPDGVNTWTNNNAFYYIKLAKDTIDGYIDEDTGAMKVGFIPIYDEYTWADGDMKQILLGNYAKIYWNRSLVTDSNDTAYILGTQNDAISFNGCFILITYNKNDLENKDYSYLRPITINSTNIMTQCYFGDKYNTGFLLKPNDPGCKIKYLKYSSSNYITVTPNDEQHDIFILLDNILSNILPNYNSSEHTYYTTSGSTKVNHHIVCNSFRYWDEEYAELFKNFNIKSYQQTNGGIYEHINVSKNLSYCLGTLSCANDAANYIQFVFIVYDVFVFPEDYLNVIPLGFFTIDNVKYNIDRFNVNNIISYPEHTYGSIYYDTYINNIDVNNKSNATLDFIKANYPDILSISRTFLKDISNKYMYKTKLEAGDPAYVQDENEYYPDLSNIHHTHNWYWRTQHPGNSANPGSASADYTKYVNRYNVQQATGVSSTYYTDYANDNDYFYTLYRASKEGLVYTTKDYNDNTVSYMYSSDTYKVWPNNYAALSLTEYSYSYSYLYYS